MRRFLAVLVLAVSLGSALPACADSNGSITVQLVASGWSDAAPADVEAVLKSVVTNETRDMTLTEPIVVIVRHGDEPITDFARDPSGAFLVTLAVEGRQWAQFAYQFSHELCHVLSLNQRTIETNTDWFEESMCEAVSLETLRRMAITWKKQPPFPNWKSYSKSLDDYWQQVAARPTRQLPKGDSLQNWYACRAIEFANDPTDRERNGVVANALLKSLRSPEALASIVWMNRSNLAHARTMASFVGSWKRSTEDQKQRRAIDQMINPFVAATTCQTKAG